MEVLGLLVAPGALVAAVLSWLAAHPANRISGEPNEIARRALAISEAEHAERERERKARAQQLLDAMTGARHDVRFHISGVKHFHHAQVGDLELNYERLGVVFDSGLTILTYTGHGAPSDTGGQ